MSLSTMTSSGESNIPNGWAGQIDSELSLESRRPLENRKITEALQVIDHDIEQLLQLRSDLSTYGLVKLTDSTTVTNSTGLALPASEKNPAVQGTMAHDLVSQNVWTSELITKFQPGYSMTNEPDGIRVFKNKKGGRMISGLLTVENGTVGEQLFELPSGYEFRGDRQAWFYMVNSGNSYPVTLAIWDKFVASWGSASIPSGIYVINFCY